MTMATVIKRHGGKGYMAKTLWDIALSTDWRPIHVIEPYCGGASFTLEGLARDLPFSFVINDIDRTLTTFWRVLQSETWFGQFKRYVDAVPFSEKEWNDADTMLASDNPAPEWLRAARFFIHNRQSLSGRMTSFTGITKTRVRRRMNNEVSAWLTAVGGLPEFHAMLRKVLILDARPAVEVIRSQDTPGTLFYCDPPYLFSTRSTTGEYGAGEMSDEQHRELLETLAGVQGRFMLSGYESPLYAEYAERQGWAVHRFDLPNNAAGGKEKQRKIEVVWCNFVSR